MVIAPEDFRDEEFIAQADALQKAGIGFDVASTRRGGCTGMLGAKTTAALALDEVDPLPYDGIIIVGGSGSQSYLWDNRALGTLVRYFHEQGRIVAAICLAPVVLARAGILNGKKATCFGSPAAIGAMKAGGAVLVDKAVVADMRIITANGPAAAPEFAKTVVRSLAEGRS
jgi:protease I